MEFRKLPMFMFGETTYPKRVLFGEFEILGKQAHANPSFSRVSWAKLAKIAKIKTTKIKLS